MSFKVLVQNILPLTFLVTSYSLFAQAIDQPNSTQGAPTVQSSEQDSTATGRAKNALKNLGDKAGEYWNKANEKAEEANKSLTGEKSSREWREDSRYLIVANYSSYDLIVPGKKGLTFGYNTSADKTWELEYLTASFTGPSAFKQISSVAEQRLSLLSRSFSARNSFSGFLGVSWNSFEVSLGNDTLTKLGVISTPKSTLLRLDTLGVNLGMGNRWSIWKGVTIGSDWIGVSQPLYTLRKNMSVLDQAVNRSERDKVEKALKVAMYMPRLYILKLQLGMVF